MLMTPGTECAGENNSFHPTLRWFSFLPVDVEDEETTGEVNKSPDLSTLYMLQIVSKAIDISLAKVRVIMVNINRWGRFLFEFP